MSTPLESEFPSYFTDTGAGEGLLVPAPSWPPFFTRIRFLGKGGMGAVYAAWDERTQRHVALKLTHAAKPRARERFLREGQFAATIQHPNVVRVHEVLELGRALVLVSELVEGGKSLADAWAERELPARIDLLIETTRGLEAIHAAGIFHRDLKPENVLVDAAGQVKITDFGIAFSQDLERLTQTGASVGTPCYMAPEQVQARAEPSAATDVWSLGVLLYQALSDELPFSGASLLEVLQQLSAGLTSTHMRRLAPAPPALRELVVAALVRDRAARLPSAAEFRARLEAWRADPQRERRRRRAGILAGLVASLLLGALAVVSASGAPPATARTPSATPSETPTPSLARPELAPLRDPDPLVAYAIAARLRESADPRLREAALAHLRAVGREPLARVPATWPVAWLEPEAARLYLFERGGVRVWRAGQLEGALSLPFVPHPRASLGPRGLLVHAEWRTRDTPGLALVGPDARANWRVEASSGERVTAAIELPDGSVLAGHDAGLRLYSSAGAVLAEAPLPGERMQWGRRTREGFLVLSADPPQPGVAGFSQLHAFGPDLRRHDVLLRLPGRRVYAAPDLAEGSVLLANSPFGRISVLALATQEERVLFTFRAMAGERGPLRAVSWSDAERRVLVFSTTDASPGRIDCWDATEAATRRWSWRLPGALTCTFAGRSPSDPTFAVVGFQREVRVYGLFHE